MDTRTNSLDLLGLIPTLLNNSTPLHNSRSIQLFGLYLESVFKSDPKWYVPLLTSSRGHQILAEIEEASWRDTLVRDLLYQHSNSSEMMAFCLFAQSTMSDPQNPNWSTLLLCSKLSPKALFDAIKHFIHPDQAAALAQLQAALPTTPPPLPRSNVPQAALPLLFPSLDTTQFAPQFDWFMYLLTKYCPNQKDYNKKLPGILDRLQPGASLDPVFVHNHLLNSYGEYLHYKLPTILPQLQEQQGEEEHQQEQKQQQPHSSPPALLFPYFPNPHPILSPISSAQSFESLLAEPTEDFMYYFVYMFLLGPSLHCTKGLTRVTTHSSLSFASQFCIYQYRAWHLANLANKSPQSITTATTTTTNDRDNTLASPPYSTATNNTSNNPYYQISNTQPPNLASNPAALLQLALSSVYSDFPHLILQPDHDPIQHFQSILHQVNDSPHVDHCLLFYIIYHCFANNHAVRDALVTKISRFVLTYGLQINFSHLLYLHGNPTHHQLAYRTLHQSLRDNESDSHATTTDSKSEPTKRADALTFISSPFLCFDQQESAFDWPTLSKHITLCVHAGFLSPLSPNHDQDNNQQQTQLTTFRAFLRAILIRLTGFISYFPQSTQLLATAIQTFAIISRFEAQGLALRYHLLHPTIDIAATPPHDFPDPRDSALNLKAALVDDDGNLFAVQYFTSQTTASQIVTPGADYEMPPWRSWFPFQGAPRHQHIERHAVIDGLRRCYIVGSENDRDPYHCSRTSSDDLDWIESEENQLALKSPETSRLQKQLTAYYRQVNEFETNMVISQLQKVLIKADQAGLFDLDNSASKRKQPPRSDTTSSSDAQQNPTTTSTTTTQDNAKGHTYPFPSFSASPNLTFSKSSSSHDETCSQPRGVLLDGKKIFYDHNYRAIWVDNELSQGKDGDMLPFFRQRSEWALELLIVGCLGLQPLPPSTTTTTTATTPSSPSPFRQTLSTGSSTVDLSHHAARIQYSKDHVLQRFPTLFGALQPILPTSPPDAQSLGRLDYYYDTLSHLILLTTLPLCETLLTLPSTPQ